MPIPPVAPNDGSAANEEQILANIVAENAKQLVKVREEARRMLSNAAGQPETVSSAEGFDADLLENFNNASRNLALQQLFMAWQLLRTTHRLNEKVDALMKAALTIIEKEEANNG